VTSSGNGNRHCTGSYFFAPDHEEWLSLFRRRQNSHRFAPIRCAGGRRSPQDAVGKPAIRSVRFTGTLNMFASRPTTWALRSSPAFGSAGTTDQELFPNRSELVVLESFRIACQTPLPGIGKSWREREASLIRAPIPVVGENRCRGRILSASIPRRIGRQRAARMPSVMSLRIIEHFRSVPDAANHRRSLTCQWSASPRDSCRTRARTGHGPCRPDLA